MSSQKAFASTGDLAEKKISFTEIGPDLYAFTAEGDPNTGVIVGDDSCAVFDAQATPGMARSVVEKVRTVTDKPIKYVILSHYHAVRVLGASGFNPQGASSRPKKPIASSSSEGSRIGNRNTAVFRDCSRMRKVFPALLGQRMPSKAK